eukprot:gene32062-biopygen9611
MRYERGTIAVHCGTIAVQLRYTDFPQVSAQVAGYGCANAIHSGTKGIHDCAKGIHEHPSWFHSCAEEIHRRSHGHSCSEYTLVWRSQFQHRSSRSLLYQPTSATYEGSPCGRFADRIADDVPTITDADHEGAGRFLHECR